MARESKSKSPALIALCLYGKFGNRFSKSAGEDGFAHLKTRLLDRFEVDVHVYSHDIEHAKQIRSKYEPWLRSSIFEASPNYLEQVVAAGINPTDFNPIEPGRTVDNSIAFFAQRARAIALALEHQASRKLPYEWIITSRFDSATIDRHNGYHEYRVSELGFHYKYPRDFIYSAMWRQLNAGFADQWFFGSPEIMRELVEMPSFVLKKLGEQSSYLNFLNGIPDSNSKDPFSNEMIHVGALGGPYPQTRKFDGAIDNHLLHKFFFVETGLYQRTKFSAVLPDVVNVLYTHSDYEDVWPAYFGELERFGLMFDRYVAISDRFNVATPDYFEKLTYRDSDPYVERLKAALEDVNDDLIFFNHEDMIPTAFPLVSRLLEAKQLLVDENRLGGPPFDFVRLINGGAYRTKSIPGARFFRELRKSSRWKFSIQPSLWRKKSLLTLLEQATEKTIWEFETEAQSIVTDLGFRGAVPKRNGEKRGKHHWDSVGYPFIATAIVKGKWNYSEYPKELDDLADRYGIDFSERGIT